MIGDTAALIATATRASTPDARSGPASDAGAAAAGKPAAASGQSLPPPAPPPPPVVDVAKAVERLNELMTSRNRSLRFEVDHASGRTVITVINDATKEVVRQIPPPDLLQIASNLDAVGSLIDARA